MQQFYRLILQFLVSDCDTHRTSQIADKKSWNLECRLAGADDSPQLMRSVPLSYSSFILCNSRENLPRQLAVDYYYYWHYKLEDLCKPKGEKIFGWRVSSMPSKDHGKQDDKRLACLHAVHRRGQLEFSL